jgi:hypothetical protein
VCHFKEAQVVIVVPLPGEKLTNYHAQGIFLSSAAIFTDLPNLSKPQALKINHECNVYCRVSSIKHCMTSIQGCLCLHCFKLEE